MKRKNGFTLIELLAVIIILGILMIIAIPSVTSYINNSRKSAYVDTAKQVIAGARNLVNSGKFEIYDTNYTYFIPNSCIEVENGDKATSPYGKFIDDSTYVVVTYNGKGFDYYWLSLDETGQGVKEATKLEKLDESAIEPNLTKDDINTSLGLDNRKKIRIYSSNCDSYTDDDSQVKFSLTSGNINDLKIGDQLCIDTECFNIIKIDNDDITLLAKYNLYVSTIYDYSHNFISKILESDPLYLKQIPAELKNDYTRVYGATEFSKTNYWHVSGNSYPMEIYDSTKNSKPGINDSGRMTGDSNTSIAYYVLEYEKILAEMGASIKNIRIPTRSEIVNLSDKSFIDVKTFWLSTAYNSEDIYTYGSGSSTYFRYTAYSSTGIRPVIEIKRSSIK